MIFSPLLTNKYIYSLPPSEGCLIFEHSVVLNSTHTSYLFFSSCKVIFCCAVCLPRRALCPPYSPLSPSPLPLSPYTRGYPIHLIVIQTKIFRSYYAHVFNSMLPENRTQIGPRFKGTVSRDLDELQVV